MSETLQPESPRELFVKRDILELIRAGRKTLEVRVGYPNLTSGSQALTVGQRLALRSGDPRPVLVEVTGLRSYDTVTELLKAEPLEQILPDATEAEARERASQLFKATDVAAYGLLVIEFQLV